MEAHEVLTEGSVLIRGREAPDVLGRPGLAPRTWMRRVAQPDESGEEDPDETFAAKADETSESLETEPEPDYVEAELYCELI